MQFYLTRASQVCNYQEVINFYTFSLWWNLDLKISQDKIIFWWYFIHWLYFISMYSFLANGERKIHCIRSDPEPIVCHRPLPVAQLDCAPWKKSLKHSLPTSTSCSSRWIDVSMTMYNTARRGALPLAALCVTKQR